MRIESTPRGLLSAFFRQKYRIFFCTALVVVAVAAYLKTATHYYESNGSLLIRFGASARPDISTSRMGAGMDMSETDEHNLISSDIEILQSHDLLLPLVKEFGADTLYPGSVEKFHGEAQAEEAAVSRLTGSDEIVKPDLTSPVILIQVFNQTPAIAQKFAKRLMEVFTQRQSQLFEDTQIGFLEGEVNRASGVLAERQKALADFKSRSKLTNIEAETDELMQQKTDAKSAAIQQVTDAEQALDEVRAKQATLMTTYQAGSPAVMRQSGDVAMAERRVQERRADLKALSDTNSAETGGPLTGHIQDINRRMAQLEAQRTQFNDLTRGVQLAEMDYKNFEGHYEEALAAQKMKMDNITRVSVLDQPQLPILPTRPKTILVALLGALAAILLGLGVGIASETLDDRFVNPEQISAMLRLPVMATFGKARGGNHD